MKKYHKIQSIFKRDEKTHKFIEGQYSLPEIEFLKDNMWVFTEKIDGTNTRIGWDGSRSFLGGRTENAQIPAFLIQRLQDILPPEKLNEVFPDLQETFEVPIILYGEVYGARIQKEGGNYIRDGVDFILFDVLINGYWLKRVDVEDLASKLGLKVVPVIGKGTLGDAMNLVKEGFHSTFGDFLAEGLVLKPEIDLYSRMGHRIVTKVKHKDF